MPGARVEARQESIVLKTESGSESRQIEKQTAGEGFFCPYQLFAFGNRVN
jgi:hypothetical protein